MAPETLSFSCPHCRTRLTVPARLAGVTGPCPSCRGPITAPGPAAVSPPPVVTVEALPVPEGPKIRPEPRQRPERGHPAPLAPRRSTEDDLLRPRETMYVARSPRSNRLVHAFIPAAFSALAVTVVYLLLYFYLPDGPGRKLKEARMPLIVPPRMERVPAPPANVFVEEVPPAPPAPPVVADAAPPADEESPAVVAYSVRDGFLRAQDAASRVGLEEPAATVDELPATLLKGPLPEVSQIFSELPRRNAVEQVTDFPYRVSLFHEGKPNVDFAVLVRQRGDQPPKVFLPAFLDLVGGRLADFTRQANTLDPARFHVILEPVIGCHEERVPNAERKFTLKLLSSNFGKETARAYCANGSRFRKMVEQPDYPIRWGTRVPATVTLQWNHREDPARPFLELIDINSPDWNP